MAASFARIFQPEDFTPPPPSLPPLTPAAYLALRRKASGLSVEEVARRLAKTPDAVPVAADLLRSLETPGVVAKLCHTLEHLRAAFAFEPEVYRQLQERPGRHPNVCRSCGCTAWDEPEPFGDAVRMVSATSCARCDQAGAEGVGQ